MEQYDQIEAPDAKGFALFRRVRDGKTAQVKAAWFKPAPDGNGMIPRSRVKAVRLAMLDWE